MEEDYIEMKVMFKGVDILYNLNCDTDEKNLLEVLDIVTNKVKKKILENYTKVDRWSLND